MNDAGDGERSSNGREGDRLDGWKEVARYIGRGVRTAQRWEKVLDLPVHRIRASGGEVVFAYRSEIDGWRDRVSLEIAAETDEPREGSAAQDMWYTDPGGRESNHVIVEVAPSATCGGRLADLVAVSVVVEPGNVGAGDSVSLTFTIRNDGVAPAPATRARLRLGSSPLRATLVDLVLADEPVPALQPKESATRHLRAPLPAGTPPGTYYVWVVADNDGLVPQFFAVNDFVRSAAIVVHH